MRRLPDFRNPGGGRDRFGQRGRGPVQRGSVSLPDDVDGVTPVDYRTGQSETPCHPAYRRTHSHPLNHTAQFYLLFVKFHSIFNPTGPAGSFCGTIRKSIQISSASLFVVFRFFLHHTFCCSGKFTLGKRARSVETGTKKVNRTDSDSERELHAPRTQRIHFRDFLMTAQGNWFASAGRRPRPDGQGGP